jgi:serine/threonine protein kinase
MIGKAISHYKILEKLGEGGMGVVYRAQDTKLDRIGCLKFLLNHLVCNQEAEARFKQAARTATVLNHADISTIYEIDETEGECLTYTEHVEGRSIEQFLFVIGTSQTDPGSP